jgi:anti-sigma regulatory factor (Ser/Thr protein kinase)
MGDSATGRRCRRAVPRPGEVGWTGWVAHVVDPHPGILLELTSELRHARVARTTVAAALTLADFSIDRIDDVRLMVDEAFSALAVAGATRIEFRLQVDHARVEMTIRGHGSRWVADEFGMLALIGEVVAPGSSLETHDDGSAVFAAVIVDHDRR